MTNQTTPSTWDEFTAYAGETYDVKIKMDIAGLAVFIPYKYHGENKSIKLDRFGTIWFDSNILSKDRTIAQMTSFIQSILDPRKEQQ